MVARSETGLDSGLLVPQISSNARSRGGVVVLMRQVVSRASQARSSGCPGTRNTVLSVLSTGQLVSHGSVLASRESTFSNPGRVRLERGGTPVSPSNALVARGGVPRCAGSIVRRIVAAVGIVDVGRVVRVLVRGIVFMVVVSSRQARHGSARGRRGGVVGVGRVGSGGSSADGCAETEVCEAVVSVLVGHC